MKKGKLLTLLLMVALVFACKEVKKSGNELDAMPEYGENLTNPPNADANKDSKIKIVPIEHATAVVEWENLTIYIDPTGGAAAFEGFKQPDLILITDIHGDHFNMETLEELKLEKAKIIVPQAVADKFPDTFSSQLEVLNNGAKTEIHNITIEAIPMYNLREEALQFHEKGRGNGYVLNLGGERIYFSGDTEDIPEMRALKNIDKAFICMNLPYTMTVESAADAVLAFQPKQVYPYHFRGNPEVGNVAKFKELVNKGNKDIEVVQLDWYPKEEY